MLISNKKFESEITSTISVKDHIPYVDYDSFEKMIKCTLEFRIPVKLLISNELSELEVYTLLGKSVMDKIKNGE